MKDSKIDNFVLIYYKFGMLGLKKRIIIRAITFDAFVDKGKFCAPIFYTLRYCV